MTEGHPYKVRKVRLYISTWYAGRRVVSGTACGSVPETGVSRGVTGVVPQIGHASVTLRS
jgi:hypothetical protein